MTEVSINLPRSRPVQMEQSDGAECPGGIAKEHSSNSKILADLYSRYVDRVYRYVFINVRDTQVAQDLTSETFLAALKDLHNFRGEGTLGAWVLGIAHHKIKDYFRSHRSLLALDAIEYVASVDPSPAELAENQWQLEQVSRILYTLTPDRADALSLHVFAGLSIDEISRTLGKSNAAVRMLIYRAIQDLRTRLAPNGG